MLLLREQPQARADDIRGGPVVAGIDPLVVMDIQKIIDQLKARGIGVIITDHNVRETLSICDRAYIIKGGNIIKHGSPQEIASDAQVREIYLGKNFQLA